MSVTPSQLSDRSAIRYVRAAIRRAESRQDAETLAFYGGFYALKLAECRAFAYAYDLPIGAVVGACAAFSPGYNPDGDTDALKWLTALGPDVKPDGDNRPRHIAIPYGYASFKLAHDVLWGRVSAHDAMPRNVKRGEYLRAIEGDPTAWVIDIHCWRDMIGASDRDAVSLPSISKPQYARLRAAMVRSRLTPFDQAVIWGDRRSAGLAHRNYSN